ARAAHAQETVHEGVVDRPLKPGNFLELPQPPGRQPLRQYRPPLLVRSLQGERRRPRRHDIRPDRQLLTITVSVTGWATSSGRARRRARTFCVVTVNSFTVRLASTSVRS